MKLHCKESTRLAAASFHLLRTKCTFPSAPPCMLREAASSSNTLPFSRPYETSGRVSHSMWLGILLGVLDIDDVVLARNCLII